MYKKIAGNSIPGTAANPAAIGSVIELELIKPLIKSI